MELETKQDVNDRIDELEAALLENFETVDCPVKHGFLFGFYIRQMFVPAGTIITSLIHNTRHTYQVTEGMAKVKINKGEWKIIKAGDCGVTEPGTRRIFEIVSDLRWTTFHPITESELPLDMSKEEIDKAVEKIGNRIIDKHENKLLGGVVKNNVLVKSIDI